MKTSLPVLVYRAVAVLAIAVPGYMLYYASLRIESPWILWFAGLIAFGLRIIEWELVDKKNEGEP